MLEHVLKLSACDITLFVQSCATKAKQMTSPRLESDRTFQTLRHEANIPVWAAAPRLNGGFELSLWFFLQITETLFRFL